MRLAPTPSGYLHTGNAVNFILNWVICRQQKGRLRLRIDDLDRKRFRLEYLEDIFLTLDWLGLDIDEGPSGVEDFEQHFSQELRMEKYQIALDELEEKLMLYNCSCSRKQVRGEAVNGFYSKNCREKNWPYEKGKTNRRIKIRENSRIKIISLAKDFQAFEVSGESPATFSTQNNLIEVNQYIDDFVVWKKDNRPAYQLASLIDDHLYEINFIIRGMDLLSSSYSQLYLDQQLGLDHLSNTIFWHHPLIKDPKGNKLSKSAGAVALKSWRDNGQSSEPLFDQAARWLGFNNAQQLNDYISLPIY